MFALLRARGSANVLTNGGRATRYDKLDVEPLATARCASAAAALRRLRPIPRRWWSGWTTVSSTMAWGTAVPAGLDEPDEVVRVEGAHPR